ncbi:MAG: cell division protein FtsA [Bacillota bacterium]
MTAQQEQEDYIFALDIGTRTLIGVLMVKEGEKYEVLTSRVIYHSTRAMMDGQIHNIQEVASRCSSLITDIEEESGLKIKKVALAAAGRALETVEVTGEIDFNQKKTVKAEDINALEFSAIQQAQEEVVKRSEKNSKADYHFVGYSVREFRLDDMFLTDLHQQRGSNIQADLIVTFLPQVVVDSLLAVINELGLEVSGLTLEPIAASKVVIPRDMYNFNLALVDIGAGTADIAVTKSGSMIGYGMVPVAGDEITEKIAEKYLIDYHSAEDIKCGLDNSDKFEVKNAIGMTTEIQKKDIIEVISGQIESMAGLIAEKILKINNEPPKAVICIGGGSLTPNFTEKLAELLNLPSDRVGIRDADDLRNIKGKVKDIAGTQTITPIGIGIIADQNKEKTIFTRVSVNGEDVRLFSLQQPLVRDALISASVDPKLIQGRPGKGITCTVNGELKTIPGEFGSPGYVKLNGEEVELNQELKNGDKIEFKSGRKGSDARARIKDLFSDDMLEEKVIQYQGENISIKPKIEVDGCLVESDLRVKDGMEIEFMPVKTIGQAIRNLLELDYIPENNYIKANISGKEKFLPRSEWFITDGSRPLDLSSPLKHKQNIEVKRMGKVETVNDLLNYLDFEKNKTELFFNGSRLVIDEKISSIKINGEEVSFNYKLKNEDSIEFVNKKLTVDQTLDIINYSLSDKMKENARIFINGEEGEFKDSLKTGDRIKLKFIK